MTGDQPALGLGYVEVKKERWGRREEDSAGGKEVKRLSLTCVEIKKRDREVICEEIKARAVASAERRNGRAGLIFIAWGKKEKLKAKEFS